MIGCNVLVLLGSIAAAITTTIGGVIGANALIGLGGAGQLSYAITLEEPLPYKARGYIFCVVSIAALPVNAFGPVIAKAFAAEAAKKRRWCYYLNIVTTGIATIAFYLFYRPPLRCCMWASRLITSVSS